MGVELVVVEKATVEGESGFAVRCHAGTLHVGDTLRRGIDPSGATHTVDLRCVAIYLAPATPADSLATNFGGGIILDGDGLGVIEPNWTLCAS